MPMAMAYRQKEELAPKTPAFSLGRYSAKILLLPLSFSAISLIHPLPSINHSSYYVE